MARSNYKADLKITVEINSDKRRIKVLDNGKKIVQQFKEIADMSKSGSEIDSGVIFKPHTSLDAGKPIFDLRQKLDKKRKKDPIDLNQVMPNMEKLSIKDDHRSTSKAAQRFFHTINDEGFAKENQKQGNFFNSLNNERTLAWVKEGSAIISKTNGVDSLESIDMGSRIFYKEEKKISFPSIRIPNKAKSVLSVDTTDNKFDLPTFKAKGKEQENDVQNKVNSTDMPFPKYFAYPEKQQQNEVQQKVDIPTESPVQKSLIYPAVGSNITIFPTHIVSVEEFFGLSVNDQSINKLNKKLNDPENTKRYRPCYKPRVFDLVLVANEDNHIHRAKIINILDATFLKVFHLDYGRCSIVPLDDVFCWEQWFNEIPFQAMHFRMDNVRKLQPNDLKSISKFNDLILYKDITAIVVSVSPHIVHKKSVTVRLYDDGDNCLNNYLISHLPFK